MVNQIDNKMRDLIYLAIAAAAGGAALCFAIINQIYNLV